MELHYDSFYRSGKTVQITNSGYTLNTAYDWWAGTDSSHTSYMPSGQTETLKNANGNTIATTSLNYTYDVLGNIETVKEGSTQKLKYYYDDLNQLIREDNKYLNKTIVYSYDFGGNITGTAEYAYQTGATVTGTATAANSYTYGDSNWRDKLTKYNGTNITYDNIGNPLSYYNGYSFTWQKGRQLAGASNGTNTVSYTYNSEGYRTSKTVNGTPVQYTLEGDRVLFEWNGTTHLWYYYDASGAPVAFSLTSNKQYFYRKNLQGDITGVYSGETGDLLVSYVYDAWGKVTATDVAHTTESANVLYYNPYLYRGYRYDAETSLYYLNSRYYDPETGRFINADGTICTNQGIHSANMFSYCENNPVNNIDQNGCWSASIFVNFDLTFFVGTSFSIGLSYDNESNLAFQFSYTLPSTLAYNSEHIGGINLSASAGAQVVLKGNVYDLEKTTTYIGVSMGAGGEFSGDTIYSGVAANDNSINKSPDGYSVAWGKGYGYDSHIKQPITKTIARINIKRLRKSFRIMRKMSEYLNLLE